MTHPDLDELNTSSENGGVLLIRMSPIERALGQFGCVWSQGG